MYWKGRKHHFSCLLDTFQSRQNFLFEIFNEYLWRKKSLTTRLTMLYTQTLPSKIRPRHLHVIGVLSEAPWTPADVLMNKWCCYCRVTETIQRHAAKVDQNQKGPESMFKETTSRWDTCTLSMIQTVLYFIWIFWMKDREMEGLISLLPPLVKISSSGWYPGV